MQRAAVAGRASAQVFEATQCSGREQARTVRWSSGAAESGSRAEDSGPVAPPCQGGCSAAGDWSCAAMRCKTALDAAGRRMPYEGAEASLCGTIGQQTLDAQRGVLLHLGALGMLRPFIVVMISGVLRCPVDLNI